MTTISKTEQLALLLHLLGKDATEAALLDIAPDTVREVRLALTDFEDHPPTAEEVELVIDDFHKYFRFAVTTASETGTEESRGGENAGKGTVPFPGPIREEEFDVALEPEKKFVQPDLTGNTVVDLNRMHPYQVAYAIRNDLPGTIAVVIRSLATEHAAKTIEFLPEAKQPGVFLKLALEQNIPRVVQDSILISTLKCAREVDERKNEVDNAETMVMLMRPMPRTMRNQMLEELMKTDEELALDVKSRMYRFEDVGSLEDRDMQTLLSQCDSDSLVYALQNADEELVERILGNMSKRARENLQDELSFKSGAKQEEIDEGRSAIVKVLVELDESGGISLD